MAPSRSIVVALLACCLLCTTAFVLRAPTAAVRSAKLLSMQLSAFDACGQHLFDTCVSLPSTLLTAAVKGDPDYVYGAVSSPDWVLPVGAVAVILTAAIPILLRPGEAALEQQRDNEAATGSEFNKRKVCVVFLHLPSPAHSMFPPFPGLAVRSGQGLALRDPGLP